MSCHKPSHSYTEVAVTLVRDLVAVLRARGSKTEFALKDLPDIVQTTPRRMKSLFYAEADRLVLKNEWLNLRYRAGLFFLNEAVRLRKLADEYEERGNDLVSGQQELDLSWEKPTNVSQRRCA